MATSPGRVRRSGTRVLASARTSRSRSDAPRPFSVSRSTSVRPVRRQRRWLPGQRLGDQLAVARPAATAVWTLNTDVGGMIEIKWIYTEFDLTGKDSLLPFIPVLTVARVGGQPFGTLANYKVAYANGDFAGISARHHVRAEPPDHLAYVQIEDEIAGGNRRLRPPRTAAVARTSRSSSAPRSRRSRAWTSSRCTRTSTPTDSTERAPAPPAPDRQRCRVARRPPTGNETGTRSVSTRAGARVRSRWIRRSTTSSVTSTPAAHGRRYAHARPTSTPGSWSTSRAASSSARCSSRPAASGRSGNEARTTSRHRASKYYEPLNLDTGYYAGWAQILALGVDYFNGGGGTLQSMATNVGYDRYGRASARLPGDVQPDAAARVLRHRQPDLDGREGRHGHQHRSRPVVRRPAAPARPAAVTRGTSVPRLTWV